MMVSFSDLGFFSLSAVLFCAITLLPEFRALWTFGERWVPVIDTPNQLGDDYHYFTLLKKLDLRVSYPRQKDSRAPDVPKITRNQIFGFMLIWPFYRFGSTIRDRRFGVLAARGGSRFLFALAAQTFVMHLLALADYGEPLLASGLFVSMFVLSDFPWDGVARNMFNPSHLYKRSHANQLVRGYATETTAPVLFLGTSFALLGVTYEDNLSWQLVAVIWLGISGYVYLPTFVGLGIFQTALFTLNGLWVASFFSSILLILISSSARQFLREDRMSSGLVFSNVRLKLPSLRSIYKAMVWNSFPFSVYALGALFLLADGPREHPSFLEISILIAALLPSFFCLFRESHLARIWDRSWEPAFLLFSLELVSTAFLSFFPHLSPAFFGGTVLLIGLGVLLWYYCLQQAVILKSDAMQIGAEDLRNAQQFLVSGKDTFVSDSLNASMWVELYTDKEALLSNYSTQCFGYEQHVCRIVRCLKETGWREEQVVQLLASNINLSDWVEDRPVKPGSNSYKKAYVYAMQYLATNREYNFDLLRDRMYIPAKGWTDRYTELIRNCFRSE